VDPAARTKDVKTGYVQVDMPAEASAVNGLTSEFLSVNGKPAADVLDEFCADVAASLMLRIPVVIMNAPYDLCVLDRDCRRNDVPTISDRLDGAPLGPIVDPLVLDKKVDKYRRRVSETQGARCLKTLAQVHGIGWDDEQAHTAEYDALQAGRVTWALMRRYTALSRGPSPSCTMRRSAGTRSRLSRSRSSSGRRATRSSLRLLAPPTLVSGKYSPPTRQSYWPTPTG
jgi:DNA polymerase-3 subunit epsilon